MSDIQRIKEQFEGYCCDNSMLYIGVMLGQDRLYSVTCKECGFQTMQKFIDNCPECNSENLGYVPMSMVSAKTRKCLECGHTWKVGNDELQ